MTPDWSALRRELAIWRSLNLHLPFWWRDDDAARPTPQLERLCTLSAETGLPVHLAVIPSLADESLAEMLRSEPQIIPLIHGWAHANHAPIGKKKAEFGAFRPQADSELRLALERMKTLFGDRLLSVFVPPWNRMDPCYNDILQKLGYLGLSTFSARPDPPEKMMQVNTHLDPIDWRGTRGLMSPDVLMDQLVLILRQRRAGRQDATEPLGYLTHHLVHDAPLWDFSRALVQEMLEGGATPTDLRSMIKDKS